MLLIDKTNIKKYDYIFVGSLVAGTIIMFINIFLKNLYLSNLYAVYICYLHFGFSIKTGKRYK